MKTRLTKNKQSHILLSTLHLAALSLSHFRVPLRLYALFRNCRTFLFHSLKGLITCPKEALILPNPREKQQTKVPQGLYASHSKPASIAFPMISIPPPQVAWQAPFRALNMPSWIKKPTPLPISFISFTRSPHLMKNSRIGYGMCRKLLSCRIRVESACPIRSAESGGTKQSALIAYYHPVVPKSPKNV